MSLKLLQVSLKLISQQRKFFLQSAYYVPTTLPMPALSPTMLEGSIVQWLVKEGDQIEVGDALCEVETDKAVVTLESNDDGFIAKILKPEGSKNIKISSPIAIIAEPGEDIAKAAQFVPTEEDSSKTEPPPKTESSLKTEPELISNVISTPVKFNSSSSLSLSPAVRHTLDWYNVQADQVTGTGPKGRILKGDVLKYVLDNNLKTQSFVERAKAPVAEVQATKLEETPKKVEPVKKTTSMTSAPILKYEDIPLTNVRKIIAQRLTESKQTIPHSYISAECNVDAIIKIRNQFKNDGIKLSMNDFIVKAVGQTLQEVKSLNKVWKGEICEENPTSDISIAVATPGGLITPILKCVESKGLKKISEETRNLAERARIGKLRPDEFQGGSFTISNLGMFGINNFTAVINPPQSCIMAVGATRKVLSAPTIEDQDEDVDKSHSVENLITVTLSFDARVIDEDQSGGFLSIFKRKLQNPFELII